MPSATAKLTVGFDADDTYRALTEAQKVAFKTDFWNEVSTQIVDQITPTTFNSWATFNVETNSSGMLSDPEIINWMNFKLGNVAGDYKAITVDAATPQPPVRYVWINGVRYCEHVFNLKLEDENWKAPTLSAAKQQVVLTLAWSTDVTPKLEKP